MDGTAVSCQVQNMVLDGPQFPRLNDDTAAVLGSAHGDRMLFTNPVKFDLRGELADFAQCGAPAHASNEEALRKHAKAHPPFDKARFGTFVEHMGVHCPRLASLISEYAEPSPVTVVRFAELLVHVPSHLSNCHGLCSCERRGAVCVAQLLQICCAQLRGVDVSHPALLTDVVGGAWHGCPIAPIMTAAVV